MAEPIILPDGTTQVGYIWDADLMTSDAYQAVKDDWSWSYKGTYDEQVAELSNRLQQAGFKPGSAELSNAFQTIVSMVSSATNSSIFTNNPYAGKMGNQALLNYLKATMTEESASKLGLDKPIWGSDAGGYFTPATGEYVSPSDPWQRNSDGSLVLDASGKPIRYDIYAINEFYKGLYGRPATEDEIIKGLENYKITYGFNMSDEGLPAGFKVPAVSSGAAGGYSTNAYSSGTYKTLTPVKTWEQEQAELAEKRRTENAISVLTDLFTQYGLQSLIPKMKDLAIKGASDATITLELSQTEEWKTRFKANEERRKKGLAVLQPGEYIGLEDKYRQILRAYGLKRFDSDDYVSQFLSNDISPTELNSRVQLASQRVEAADPLVTSTLRRFYNITNTDLVAYMLNPDEELPKLERQVTAAEIGAKMLGQGIAANLTGKTFTGAEGGAFSNVQRGTIGVEAMMQAGATAEEAARVSKYIASVLPRAEFLSSIYGPSGYQQYGQLQAEQEGFQGLASAERARQQLVGREFAEFRGSSGISKAAFGSQSQGQF